MNPHPPEFHPDQPEALPRSVVARDEPGFAAAKMAGFQYAAVAIFLFLISGFWALQIQSPEVYSERAERNRVKIFPIGAPRGRILDRDGRVIVDNQSSWSVILSRENLKMEHLHEIADGLHLDYDDLVAKVTRYLRRSKIEPIIIKENLSMGELAFVDSHRDASTFPEMALVQLPRRVYPSDGLLAHVIGYTGEISESELDNPDYAKYNQGQIIGKTGLEKEYNDVLMGTDGERRAVVDNMGHEREMLSEVKAIPGHNLQTTIDLDLEAVAELGIEGKRGALVALDPNTGEILAMVSKPSFDPNKFAVRIKSSDWRELTANPDNPLLARAIQAQLQPGSTFKPIMALAALETGNITPATTYNCPGGATFYGHFYHCDQHHGTLDLHRAIALSCDTYFYNVGVKMGIDDIAYYAHMIGYGAKTGVDLPNEASGTVPSPEWKLRTQREKWYAGETVSVSIGQGALTVTPLQLARAIGGVAIGGVWHTPHFLKAFKEDKPTEWTLNPDNVKSVVDGMFGVVNEGGTGAGAKIQGVDICGKTGTAQTASAEYAKLHKEFKDNSWFVAFAPCYKPEIVVSMLWEGGAWGANSAPVVRDVLKSYFDKKQRTNSVQLQNQPQATPAMSLLTSPGKTGEQR
ncbi:MAG TPA: penicillin-binding protein 2 [Bryobacteraceae bacterium]